MKGLLLKDWYMIRRYFKLYFILAAIFLVLSCVKEDNIFFVIFPCMFCGVMPINLQSLDESSGWINYSGALPYARAQLVNAKYYMGLLSMIALLVVTVILQIISMTIHGSFDPMRLLMISLLMVSVMFMSASISMPFIFKYGTEKGRIIFVAIPMLYCVCISMIPELTLPDIDPYVLVMILFAVTGVLYALTWRLSIGIYEKKEI